MATYTNFEDFLPYIQMEAPGCPRDVVEEFVRKFVIRLCEKALVLRKTASEINITANERTYGLNFTENLFRPTAIVSADYESGTHMTPQNEAMLDSQSPNWRTQTTSTRPLYYWLTIDNKFAVQQMPTQDIDDDPITVECWVAPVRTATKVDTFVFNNYAETVAYGALSELQLMPGQSWNDPILAQLNGRKWRQGLRNARSESLRGKDGTQSTQVYPQSYEVFGS